MIPPEPPVNVRLVCSDGEEVPVDTVYKGERDRTHEWEVVNVPVGRVIRGLKMDMLPPQTAVRIAGQWEST
jgi:hypothetical protein